MTSKFAVTNNAFFNKQIFQQVAFGQVRLYPRTVTRKTMSKEIGIEV